ncbi:uncharacterized membrane protein DDB_G0293934-like [Panonychus citri]|uniref:uncharacterized membrane protein DDB_G0293934-like n=1 Tax=Panonychus citri TaxID=50023 RepID=UPI0023081868|nr:uncharacterized membrane protein DDB_G0293934-like [Panonychus citri]
MDYLDCACFTGRTSIPIRCIVERVSPLVSNNLTSPSSPTSPPTNVSSNSTTPPVTITTTPTSLLPLSSSSLLSPTSNLTTTTTYYNYYNHLSIIIINLTCLPIFPINCGGSSIGSTSCNPNANLTTHELISDGTTIDSKTDPLAITSSSSSSSLSSVTQSVNCFNTINKTLSPSLISKENLITPTTSSSLSSAGDKNSGEGGCTVGSESVAELKSVNSTSTSNCNNIVDENIDVNPANLTNSNNNCNLDENNINNNNSNSNNNNNTSGSVNVTGNITSNGDSCVNLTIGEKSINNNTRSPDNNNTSNSPNNQRQLNISPLQDLSNKINSESISVGQLSPTSTLRNLFGLNNNPFQLNHLNLNQSPLNYLNHNNHHHHHHHHLHHHSNLLSTNFEHSSTLNQQQQSNGDSSPGNSGSSRTFPASISPSGVVEQDSFAIITSGILFSNLVKTALLHLGYSTSEITGAKGFIQLRNWKPLTLDQITDSVDATVGDIMGDISSIASLRIILSK